MSGRGDNNKHGSAGRGASNQSNQPFVTDGENEPRSNANKSGSPAEPSTPDQASKPSDAQRATGETGSGLRSGKTLEAKTLNLLVDDVPYIVKATPFHFNDDIRYEVSINSSASHIFVWDAQLKVLRAIDDDAGTIPDGLEEEIGRTLSNQ